MRAALRGQRDGARAGDVRQRFLGRGSALPELRALVWKEPGFRASLAVRELAAEVRFEALGRARVTLAVAGPMAARLALEASRSLPGNLRYARNGHGLELLADAWSGDPRAATLALREIRGGLVRAGSATSKSKHNEAPAAPGALRSLQTALAEHGETELVEQRDGFELSPRVHGNPIRVLVRVEGTGLRLSRALELGASDSARAALDLLALELNARLRFARIVALPSGAARTSTSAAPTSPAPLAGAASYAVEARLSAGLVDAARVLASARAIAAANEHAWPRLRVLATEAHVADAYVRTFGAPH